MSNQEFNPLNQQSLLSYQQKKTLVLSSLGGVLEFFDFIIYIFLVPYLEKLFFASDSSYVTTLKTLAVFSAGYLVRPFGGVIFAHFGDRYGRKVVFLLTVLFMAIPAFAIGILPSSEQIGILAPMLLLVFRLMQGLAIGGEIPAAITFISEHIGENRRGFAMAVLFSGINLGLMLGSLATYLLTVFFTEQQILAYAWRIPFIIGGIFGLVSLFVRRHLQETSAFKSLKHEEKPAIPFAFLIKNYLEQTFQGVALVSFAALCVFMYLYWPQYLHQYLQYDFSMVMRLNTIGTFVLAITILIGGVISDRFGHYKTYFYSILIMAILILPIYGLFGMKHMALLYVAYMAYTFLFGLFPSCYGAILPRLFPTEARYSGIAISYNLSFAIFSGISPVLCTWLIHRFESFFAPAWYMLAVALFSGTVAWFGYQKHTKAERVRA